MSPQLTAAFRLIAETGRDLQDWWIIGSAALSLYGIGTGEPDDVDIFASRRVIETLLNRLGEDIRQANPSDRFSSAPYQRIIRPGMTDIEMMGDLKVASSGAWQAVTFKSRVSFDVQGGRVFAPNLHEQADLFRLFGRPKDMDKFALVTAALR